MDPQIHGGYNAKLLNIRRGIGNHDDRRSRSVYDISGMDHFDQCRGYAPPLWDHALDWIWRIHEGEMDELRSWFCNLEKPFGKCSEQCKICSGMERDQYPYLGNQLKMEL